MPAWLNGTAWKVLTPDADDRDTVHRIIYEELCLGRIKAESRDVYIEVIARLVEQGAQAVILGCTEISLLIEPKHVNIPLFDTTQLHAVYAADWMLGGKPED